MSKIVLKPHKTDSILRFHPWIFSGAIAKTDRDVMEGDVVDVYSAEGEFLALGHYQIGSIAVRILSFTPIDIDQKWWTARLYDAYAVRNALSLTDNRQTTCYRLVHGEGDMLPGLIIDIYGEVAVVQCHSVGMFRSREAICNAIRELYGSRIRAIYDKSSQTVPFKAGLDAVDGTLWGDDSLSEGVVSENGHQFAVDWSRGQKTGFFIDQRSNRELVEHYASSRRVLNTFCYTGGFSVYALAGGAKEVCSIDSSREAIELTRRNVELNFGPDAPHTAITADVLDYIKDIPARYDMIILDPPAFAKHHKVVGNAMQGYKRLNAKAIAQIAPGGILFTFSCSRADSSPAFAAGRPSDQHLSPRGRIS